MEIFLILLGLGIFWWLLDDGPQELLAQYRKSAEANSRAEQAKLERIRLENQNRYDR